MEYKDYELLIRDLIDKKNNAIDEKEKEIIRNKIRNFLRDNIKETFCKSSYY